MPSIIGFRNWEGLKAFLKNVLVKILLIERNGDDTCKGTLCL